MLAHLLATLARLLGLGGAKASEGAQGAENRTPTFKPHTAARLSSAERWYVPCTDSGNTHILATQLAVVRRF